MIPDRCSSRCWGWAIGQVPRLWQTERPLRRGQDEFLQVVGIRPCRYPAPCSGPKVQEGRTAVGQDNDRQDLRIFLWCKRCWPGGHYSYYTIYILHKHHLINVLINVSRHYSTFDVWASHEITCRRWVQLPKSVDLLSGWKLEGWKTCQ